MRSHLVLPLLSLFLSVVLCQSGGPASLIFASQIGADADRPFLATVSAERFTSIQGASTVVDPYIPDSPVVPKVSDNRFIFLEAPADYNSSDSAGPGISASGFLIYYPFRLDPNIHYLKRQSSPQAVVDNGWVFTFRAAWGEMLSQYPGYYNDASWPNLQNEYNSAWQVVLSFPTYDSIENGFGNIIIAMRSRNSRSTQPGRGTDELGVFLATDPTWSSGTFYDSTDVEVGYPAAIFTVGGNGMPRIDDGVERSYVLHVPIPQPYSDVSSSLSDDIGVEVSFDVLPGGVLSGDDILGVGNFNYLVCWSQGGPIPPFLNDYTGDIRTNCDGFGNAADVYSNAPYAYLDYLAGNLYGIWQPTIWQPWEGTNPDDSFPYLLQDVNDPPSFTSLPMNYGPSTRPLTLDGSGSYSAFITLNDLTLDPFFPDFVSLPYSDMETYLTNSLQRDAFLYSSFFVQQYQHEVASKLEQYLSSKVGITNVQVSIRAPGSINTDDISLWVEGVQIPQRTDYHVQFDKVMEYLRLVDTADAPLLSAWGTDPPSQESVDYLWYPAVRNMNPSCSPVLDCLEDPSGGSWAPFFGQAPTSNYDVYRSFSDDPDDNSHFFYIEDSASGTYVYTFSVGSLNPDVDYTPIVRDLVLQYTRDFSSNLNAMAAQTSTFTYEPFNPTSGTPVIDGFWQIGYFSGLHVEVSQRYSSGGGGITTFVVRLRDPGSAIGWFIQTNTDATGTQKRDLQQTTGIFQGPFVVVGGSPRSVSGDLLYNFRGPATNLKLADIKIFTIYAENANTAISESFLNTLVECGDGQLDAGEECDSSDPSCTTDCTCPERTLPLAPLGCTFCGNGNIEYLLGERCDYAEDPNCKEDCSACIHPDMILIQTGHSSNADGSLGDQGFCSFCGNGQLDILGSELCDSTDPHCKSDCSGCVWGESPAEQWFPTGDAKGSCNRCGNGVLDEGEVCDVYFNDHHCSSDCLSCQDGWVPVGNGECTQCGNGVVDENEQCDSALTACLPDCSGCQTVNNLEIYVARDGDCTRCGNGWLDGGEVCDPGTGGTACAEDCSGCEDGWVAKNNRLGECTLCGNGVLDAGEACDSDENCVECVDCRAPYVVSAGGACVLCGNGWLDEGEVCDAFQPGCNNSCLACADGFEPWLDFENNPTGLCFPVSCESSPSEDGACTCE